MPVELRDHRYSESGNPRIVLRATPYEVCTCGEEWITIRAMAPLHRLIDAESKDGPDVHFVFEDGAWTKVDAPCVDLKALVTVPA